MDEERFGKFGLTVVTSGVWASLPPKAKAVYPVIVVYARNQNRQAWPSNKRLAKESGLNVRSIPAATAELEKAALVKKWRHNRRNYYYLHKNGFTMSPPDMDTKTPRISPRRPRNKRGHFIAPSRTAQQTPPQTDRSTPPQMDSVPPSQMEKKKRYLRREIERDIPKKTRGPPSPPAPALVVEAPGPPAGLSGKKDKSKPREQKYDMGKLATYFASVAPEEWERHARLLEKRGYPLKILKDAMNIAADMPTTSLPLTEYSGSNA